MNYLNYYFKLLLITFLLGACTLPEVTVADTELAQLPSSDYISCNFPTNVPDASASQTEFDNYSWRMFTALSQPSSAIRGKPDCNKALGSTTNTVWRSYKYVDEIFLPEAHDPGPWNTPLNRLNKVLSLTSKVSPKAEDTIDQPVGGWLIDQRGNPTYYEIAANETSYNYIRDNDLYDKTTAENFEQIDFPTFATEIKASWRILAASDNVRRYMTSSATVATFDDNGKQISTEKALIGLVGLHIVTKAAGFPQWVWSTFEQVDNVSAEARFSSYYNASATNVNQSPCANHASPCVAIPPATFHTPDPLVRHTPIAPSTKSVNSKAQQQLAQTFLQYYELVTTQWPTNPNDPGDPAGSPTPGVAANTTMESYIQATSSCMDCHSTATVKQGKKSDFSFLFLHANSSSSSGLAKDVVHAELNPSLLSQQQRFSTPTATLN